MNGSHEAPDPMRPDEPHARDPHAGDLASGLLDGELTADQEAWVRDHLAGCEPCRAIVADTEAARDAVRGLAGLDGMPMVRAVVSRRHRVVRLGAMFVATAALALGVLGAASAPSHPVVVPDVAAMAAAHADADLTSAHPQGLETAETARAGYAAPSGLLGNRARLSRQEILAGDDLTAVGYAGDGVRVSVFQQPGVLDWSSLPDGDVEVLARGRAWIGRGVPLVAVAQLGDLVVTAVSDDRGAVLTALGSLPEHRRRSTFDRVHDACQRLTSAFALGS